MMDPETLQDIVDLIADGGTVVCNAATRDRFHAALRDADAPLTSIKFRVSAHYPDWHVMVIALDGADPYTYALTAESMP
jgi:hypothetical protein